MILLIVTLNLLYYKDMESRFFWKFSNTLNFMVLIYQIRSRIMKCMGYPVKDMSLVASTLGLGKRSCLCTRIRMKIVDYVSFYYAFFAEILLAANLATKSCTSDLERVVFIVVVTLNAVFMLLWLLCTGENTYKNFPKEERRKTLQTALIQH